jgi:hypothetical protein
MGIHHSSDTKTSHDHDNKLSNVSQHGVTVTSGQSGSRTQTGARRPGSYGVRNLSARRSTLSGPLGRARGRSCALGCPRPPSQRPPATRFHEQQNRTDFAWPAQCLLSTRASWKYPCFSSLYELAVRTEVANDI